MRAGSSVRLASLKAAKNARTAPSGVVGSGEGAVVAEGGSEVDGAGDGPSRPTTRTAPTTMRTTTMPVTTMTSGRLRSGMRFTSRPRRGRAVDRECHDGRDPCESEQWDPRRHRDLDAHGRGGVRGAGDRVGARFVGDDNLRRRGDLGRG